MKQLLLMIAVVALVGCGTTSWVSDPKDPNSVKIEAAIRDSLGKRTEGINWIIHQGEITKAHLEKVRVVDLSRKKLTEIPKGLEKLTQLKTLYLGDNQLTDVSGLENLTQLEDLGISFNQLTDVTSLEKLDQLESLHLRDNKLTDVTGLENLTKLESLYLSGNQLTDVKGLENLAKLDWLSLNHNKLTSVRGLEKLTKLERLNLGYNQLTDLKGLEKCTQLWELSLEGNKLTDVKGLEKLTKLKILVLNRNPDLTKAQIDELKKALPKCSIYSNPPLTKEESAKVIEVAIRKAANKPTGELTKADLEKVTELNLRHNPPLTSVKGLEKLTQSQLEKLNLSHNRLTNVKDLEKLNQLTHLELGGNQLTDVKGLEKFTQLMYLGLRGNKLTKAQIDQLQKALPNCKITSNPTLTKEESAKVIEAAIRKKIKKPEGELTKADYEKVTGLRLIDKKLTSVKGLEKLTQLTYLNLGDNQLTDVKSLEKLTQLKNLHLQGNQLTDVKGLEKLTQLTVLSLNTNPDLTKAQIDELQKALPNCRIESNPTK